MFFISNENEEYIIYLFEKSKFKIIKNLKLILYKATYNKT